MHRWHAGKIPNGMLNLHEITTQNSTPPNFKRFLITANRRQCATADFMEIHTIGQSKIHK